MPLGALRAAHDCQVQLRLLLRHDPPGVEVPFRLRERCVLRSPERSVLVDVGEQSRQDVEQSPIQPLFDLRRGSVEQCPRERRHRRVHVRRQGERGPRRAPARVHAEVTSLGDVDQEVAPRRRRVGLQQCVDADEPILVEVVVGDDVGRNVQLGAVEVVEHDGRRRVRHQLGRGAAPPPVGQRDERAVVRRPVDDDVRLGRGVGVRQVSHEGCSSDTPRNSIPRPLNAPVPPAGPRKHTDNRAGDPALRVRFVARATTRRRTLGRPARAEEIRSPQGAEAASAAWERGHHD